MLTLATIGLGLGGGSFIMAAFQLAYGPPGERSFHAVVSGAVVGAALGAIMAWLKLPERPTGESGGWLAPLVLGLVASCISFSWAYWSPPPPTQRELGLDFELSLVLGVMVSPAWMALAGILGRRPGITEWRN